MVDAVTSVTNTLKTYMQRKKDQDIAWERLTPSQVLQYVAEGQEVPQEILRWAEDVNKLQNAPDDVTYASVNGASSEDDVSDSVSQGDEPDADDAAEKVTLTQAQEFRQTMEMNGESKYSQGKALARKSVESTLNEKFMEARLEKNSKEAEKVSTVAEIKSKITESKTSSMKQELNELLEKAQSKDKNLSPADLNRIAELGGQLNMIGMQAQSELAQIGAQLAELEAEIQQFEAIPPTATDFGTESVAVGAELMTDDAEQQTKITDAAKNADGMNTAKVALNATRLKAFSILFNRNYRMGVRAVARGGNAMDAGAAGVGAIDAAKSSMNTEFAKIEGAQLRVEQNTGVQGFAIPRAEEQEKEEEQVKAPEEQQAQEKEEKSGEVKVVASKTEEKDVKDSTLVIDMDEKKKRREEQGLA